MGRGLVPPLFCALGWSLGAAYHLGSFCCFLECSGFFFEEEDVLFLYLNAYLDLALAYLHVFKRILIIKLIK